MSRSPSLVTMALALLCLPLVVTAFPAGGTVGIVAAQGAGTPTSVQAVSLGMADGATAPSPADQSAYIVQFSTPQALNDTLAHEWADATPIDTVWSKALNGFAASLSADEVQRLENDPDVVAIEHDSVVAISTDQSNPPWGLDRIDQRALPLSSGYSYGSTGAGVTVYVVDSGIRSSHAEFSGRTIRGAYFDFGDDTRLEDCNGHGTHVAGLIGGTTYGVAKDVTLVPVKVFNCGGTTSSSYIIGALDWIIKDHIAGVPAVVNMSLGGPASPSFDAAVSAAVADGISVVVAAGNDAADACNTSPARLPAAITVGASDIDDNVAWYSNRGTCVDLFAPGTAIVSAWDTGDTATRVASGTSMATPVVSGVAARLLQRTPAATPTQVGEALDSLSTTGALRNTRDGDPNKLIYLAPPWAESVPTAPQALTALGGNEQVSLSWALPLFDDGSLISDYAVQYKSAVDPLWSTFADGVSTATGATVTGLENGAPYWFQIAAINSLGTGTMTGSLSVTPSSGFTGLVPVRVFDTRAGEAQGAVEVVQQRYGAERVLRVSVAGVGGVPVSGVGAVSLNVTVVDPAGSGFVTVYPCGERPLASSVNFTAGEVVANAVIAPVSTSGEVCVFSSVEANLVADVNGWFALS